MNRIRKVKRDDIKARESHWKWTGVTITVDRYNALLKNQNYLCAICERHNDEFKYGLSVDHDHSSKEVRGLLCPSCNCAIGYAKDNVWILERAIKYLSRQICLDSLNRSIQ